MRVKLGLAALVHELDKAAKGDLQMALVSLTVGGEQERASCSSMQTTHVCGFFCCCKAQQQ